MVSYRALACLLTVLGLGLGGCVGMGGPALPFVAGGAGALEPGGDLDLYLYDIESGAVKRLTRTPGYREYDPALDPSRQRVAYVAERLGRGPTAREFVIRVYDLDTRTTHDFITQADRVLGPAWSSDGGTLAWGVEHDGRLQLRVRELASHRPATDLGYGSDPSFGAQDTVLFYNARDRLGEGGAAAELNYRNLDTGLFEDLGLFGTGFNNRYKGFSVVYSSLPGSRRNEAIWLLDANNRQLMLTRPEAGRRDLDPVWVEGVSRVAFTRFDPAADGVSVMVVDLADSDAGPQPLLTPGDAGLPGVEVVLTRGGERIRAGD